MSFTVALVDDGDVFPTPAETKRFTFFTAHTKRNNKKKKKEIVPYASPVKERTPFYIWRKFYSP